MHANFLLSSGYTLIMCLGSSFPNRKILHGIEGYHLIGSKHQTFEGDTCETDESFITKTLSDSASPAAVGTDNRRQIYFSKVWNSICSTPSNIYVTPIPPERYFSIPQTVKRSIRQPRIVASSNGRYGEV